MLAFSQNPWTLSPLSKYGFIAIIINDEPYLKCILYLEMSSEDSTKLSERKKTKN